MKKLLFLTLGIILLGLMTLPGFFRYYVVGIVGEITVDDRRYAVKQRWSLEGHRVGFVYELENGTWGSCYIHHQDTRWWSAQLIHNVEKDTIDIYKAGTLKARLDRRASTFELIGSISDICDAPQSFAPPLP